MSASSRDIVLWITDKVGLRLVVVDGCTCAELVSALASLFGRPPSQLHLTAGGPRLAGADAVPETDVHLVCAAAPPPHSGGQGARQALTRSVTNPTAPAKQAPGKGLSKTHADPAPATSPAESPHRGAQRRHPASGSGQRPPQKDDPQPPPSPPRRASAPDPAPGPAGGGALEEARKAVRALQPNDLRRVTKQSTPPLAALMDAVLTALGNARPSWDAAQRELSDMQFVQNLCRVEPPQDRMLRRLEALADSAAPARHEELRRAGGPAAVVLAQWVSALLGPAAPTALENGHPPAPPAAAAAAAAGAGGAAKPPQGPPGGSIGKPQPTPAPAAGGGGPAAGKSGKRRGPPGSAAQEAPSPAPAAIPQPGGGTVSFELAHAALEALSNAELREVRQLQVPPPAVSVTLAAVLTALGHRQTDWAEARRQLNNTKDFAHRLCEAAKEPDKHLELARPQVIILQKLVKDPSMAPEPVKQTPAAVRAMALWARAAHGYAVRYLRQEAAAPPPLPAAPPHEAEEGARAAPRAAAAPAPAAEAGPTPPAAEPQPDAESPAEQPAGQPAAGEPAAPQPAEEPADGPSEEGAAPAAEQPAAEPAAAEPAAAEAHAAEAHAAEAPAAEPVAAEPAAAEPAAEQTGAEEPPPPEAEPDAAPGPGESGEICTQQFDGEIPAEF